MALALQALGSNQTLDLGGLGVLGLALLGDSTADNKLADIIVLGQGEEAADLGGTLGAETLGDNGVGQTGEVVLTLLDDGQSEDGEVQTGDGWKGKGVSMLLIRFVRGLFEGTHTTTDGLALALTSAARAVAAVAVGEEQTGTDGEED